MQHLLQKKRILVCVFVCVCVLEMRNENHNPLFSSLRLSYSRLPLESSEMSPRMFWSASSLTASRFSLERAYSGPHSSPNSPSFEPKRECRCAVTRHMEKGRELCWPECIRRLISHQVHDCEVSAEVSRAYWGSDLEEKEHSLKIEGETLSSFPTECACLCFSIFGKEVIYYS